MPRTPVLYGSLRLKGLDLLLARFSDVQMFATEWGGTWGGLAMAQLVDFQHVKLEHLLVQFPVCVLWRTYRRSCKFHCQ